MICKALAEKVSAARIVEHVGVLQALSGPELFEDARFDDVDHVDGISLLVHRLVTMEALLGERQDKPVDLMTRPMADERNAQEEINLALHLFPLHLFEDSLVISPCHHSKVALASTADRRCSRNVVDQCQFSKAFSGV